MRWPSGAWPAPWPPASSAGSATDQPSHRWVAASVAGGCGRLAPTLSSSAVLALLVGWGRCWLGRGTGAGFKLGSSPRARPIAAWWRCSGAWQASFRQLGVQASGRACLGGVVQTWRWALPLLTPAGSRPRPWAASQRLEPGGKPLAAKHLIGNCWALLAGSAGLDGAVGMVSQMEACASRPSSIVMRSSG